MEWEELAKGASSEPTGSEFEDVLVDYLAAKDVATEYGSRAKMLLEQASAMVQLKDGEIMTVNASGREAPISVQGQSRFSCDAKKIKEIIDTRYSSADVPEFIQQKYTVSRKAFEELDEAKRDAVSDAITYKQAPLKIY
jgi:hypothetical protein